MQGLGLSQGLPLNIIVDLLGHAGKPILHLQFYYLVNLLSHLLVECLESTLVVDEVGVAVDG